MLNEYHDVQWKTAYVTCYVSTLEAVPGKSTPVTRCSDCWETGSHCSVLSLVVKNGQIRTVTDKKNPTV